MGVGKRRGGQGRAGGGEVEEKWEWELKWEGGGGEGGGGGGRGTLAGVDHFIHLLSRRLHSFPDTHRRTRHRHRHIHRHRIGLHTQASGFRH
jgi:hypothetical protein